LLSFANISPYSYCTFFFFFPHFFFPFVIIIISCPSPHALLGNWNKIWLPSNNGGVLSGDPKKSIAIQHNHDWMATEEFWSPFKTPTSLDGDQNSWVAQEGKWGKIFSPPKW
jgi:hypothetical protein